MLKIVFFGTSAFAVSSLSGLIENGMSPVAVITSPDRLAGRGKKMKTSPVKKFCLSGSQVANAAAWKPGFQVVQPEKIDQEFIEELKKIHPEIGVIASYGKILPKALIEIFPKGILNIHPSLLPKYRGASPIQEIILNGETETGVSIILLDEKMDHGSILSQTKFGASDVPNFVSRDLSDITYQALHDSLAKLGAELLIETISKWMTGEITPHPQDDSRATFTKLIKKDDGKIDWSKKAEEIERMVRAYNPWPGTWTETKNKKLKIIKASVIENTKNLSPGTFFEHEKFPAASCGKGALKLLVVHPEGKKEMPGNAYLLGHPNLRGSPP